MRTFFIPNVCILDQSVRLLKRGFPRKYLVVFDFRTAGLLLFFGRHVEDEDYSVSVELVVDGGAENAWGFVILSMISSFLLFPNTR